MIWMFAELVITHDALSKLQELYWMAFDWQYTITIYFVLQKKKEEFQRKVFASPNDHVHNVFQRSHLVRLLFL
jgi:hypothetical protein